MQEECFAGRRSAPLFARCPSPWTGESRPRERVPLPQAGGFTMGRLPKGGNTGVPLPTLRPTEEINTIQESYWALSAQRRRHV